MEMMTQETALWRAEAAVLCEALLEAMLGCEALLGEMEAMLGCDALEAMPECDALDTMLCWGIEPAPNLIFDEATANRHMSCRNAAVVAYAEG
jgi:hypothetical protein